MYKQLRIFDFQFFCTSFNFGVVLDSNESEHLKLR